MFPENKKIRIYIAVFALLGIMSLKGYAYSAVNGSSDDPVGDSVNAFLEDDIEGAIEALEVALSYEPKNKKYRLFLTKMLVEGLLCHYSAGEDEQSLHYAKRAEAIDYRNRKVAGLLAQLSPDRKDGKEEEQEGRYEEYEKLMLLVKSLEKEQLRKLRFDDRAENRFKKISNFSRLFS